MSEHDLEKLLGGFAADTLTPEEKQTLYTAALQDQQLFNALADEQAFKELLSDPDVRRRLLASLEQKKTSRSSASPSWLEWFRRPAGLALAGGLSAAALAVVLGGKIYQDSLRHAAESTATEEVKQATPQAVKPQAKESLAPSIDRQKKDTSMDRPAKREPSMPIPSKKERDSDTDRDSVKQRSRNDEVRSQAEAPLPSNQKLAASSAPPATAPEPKQMQPPAGGQVAATATLALSARALFYGEVPGQADMRSMAKEQEQMKPLAESAPQANRLERKQEGLSQLGKAAGTTAQLMPLGLRYSFVARGTDGQEQEVDAATVSKRTEPIFLAMEANQDAYLQIWKTAGSSAPKLYRPEKETGQSSLKMTPGHRQHLSLPMESGPITLTIHLSRVPFGPITKEVSPILDRLSPNQIQESTTANDQTGSHEQATYVVSQDPSITAQIVVEMTLGR